MRKRVIISGIVALVAIGATIWILVARSEQTTEQTKAPSEEEKILAVANNDAAASDYQLTANNVVIEKKINNWVYARVTYRSSVSGTNTTYPVVLLKDSDGDFSIVLGFDDSTLPEDLAAQHIPKSIIDAIRAAIPVPTETEDGYE